MAGRTDLEQLVYQMSTDIRALERQNKRALANVDGTANRIEARYKKIGKADVGKFLDQTFDKTRLAAFEVGASRVPIFGAALEALGPAGFAAAAGLGAVALATTGAIQAMQFADEIDDAATKLNVGTEALQEYRFALTEVGGEAKDADAAIEGFQKKLGEGLAGGRSVKWFERLGFGADDLRAFDSTEEALDAVLDRIAALGSEAERAAVAEKLGLGSIVALAGLGSERLDELRQRARDLGLVMDAELVARGAEANQQFETMAKIIDVQLKSALVDLGPVIVDVMRFVAWLAEGLADVANAFRSIEDRSRRSLMKEYNAHGEIMTRMLNRPGVNSPDDLNPLARRQFNQSNARRGEITAELADRPPTVTPGNRPGAQLAPLSGGGGGSRGKSGPSAEEIARRTAELERTLAIEIVRLQNNEELVRTLEREASIARRIEQYRGLGKSAAEAQARAAADQAQIDEARLEGLQEELRLAGIRQGIEYEQTLGNERFAQSLQDRLTLQREIEEFVQKGYDLGTATNAAERNLLEIQQARAEVMARIVADAALERQLTLARLAGDEERVRQLERAAEIGRRSRQIEGDRNLNFGEGVGQATSEVDEEIAAASRRGFRDGVRGLLDDLQDGGLEGVLSTIFDRVSDRLKDSLADMLTDYLFQSMGKGSGGGGFDIGSAISSVLGGFGRRERGGPVRSGRAYIVGEKRPEVFVPGVSGTILPNLASAGRMPMGGRGTIHQTFVLNAPGSVLAGELVAEMKAVGAQQASAAAGEAYSRAKSEIPADMAFRKKYSRP